MRVSFFSLVFSFCLFTHVFTELSVKASTEQTEGIQKTKVFSVYAYGSLASSKGLLSKLKARFEKKCQCELKVISVGSASQLISKIELDAQRKVSDADVAVGLDSLTFESVKEHAIRNPKKAVVRPPLNLPGGVSEKEWVKAGFYPFDFGVYTWMVDLDQIEKLKLKLPQSYEDLLTEAYLHKLILEDPRTSTPGLAFVAVIQEIYKDHWKEMIHKLKPQWLTLAPGWEAAYSLFTKAEAPLVWSYTSSEAYHREKGDLRHKAILLKEGSPLQIEGAVILKESIESNLFIEELTSLETQTDLPLIQYMLPVRKGVTLPSQFKDLPVPKKTFLLKLSAKERESLLTQWHESIE